MFYVAPVSAQPILGLNDYVQLDLVNRACALQPELLTKDAIRDNYPNCFKGLGNLGTYYITMVDNCTHTSPTLSKAKIASCLRQKCEVRCLGKGRPTHRLGQ